MKTVTTTLYFFYPITKQNVLFVFSCLLICSLCSLFGPPAHAKETVKEAKATSVKTTNTAKPDKAAKTAKATVKTTTAKTVKKPVKQPSLSGQQRKARLQHARELMGKYYKKSAVKSGESVKKINYTVYRKTKEFLPKKFKSQHQQIAQTIIDQSQLHGFDPLFVMAVVLSESSFDPRMRGGVGEIGLMQIRPCTAAWLAKKASLKYAGEKDLYDPIQNIKIGTAYMSYLRETFGGEAQLYIAAYNMGQRNVRKNLAKDVRPKIYPIHVMKNYLALYEDVNAKGVSQNPLFPRDIECTRIWQTSTGATTLFIEKLRFSAHIKQHDIRIFL